jgi:prepilin peptidase dependent protein B
MLISDQSGFSLVETLCALAVSSMVLLSGLHLLPKLHRQCHGGIQQMRLIQQLNHALLFIEKDIRRAGLDTVTDEHPAVIIAQRHGEPARSCLLVRYAFYAAEGHRAGQELITETFGYRMRRGALEMRRGVTHCDGPGWVKMHDTHQWQVKRLQFDPVAQNGLRVIMTGVTCGGAGDKQTLTRFIARRNA